MPSKTWVAMTTLHPRICQDNTGKQGFPSGSGGKDACRWLHCKRQRRCGFDPCIRRVPWRRKWLPTAVFLPKKSRGQRSLADYSLRGFKELDTTEWLSIAQGQKRWPCVLHPRCEEGVLPCHRKGFTTPRSSGLFCFILIIWLCIRLLTLI